MATTIQKWGNSLAVRIPKEMVRRLALREGSGIMVREDGDEIIICKQEPRERPIGKNDWRQYLISVSHKKENVSGDIDRILYGAPH